MSNVYKYICDDYSTAEGGLFVQTGAMSTAQQFRAVLMVLADVATFRKGIFMRSTVDGTTLPLPSKAVFEKHFDLVFVDSCGWLNLASRLSASALAEVLHSIVP